jgi:hypothetical protein
MIMLVSPVWGSDSGDGHNQKDFRIKLRTLIALGRRHVGREEIAEAFKGLLPTYHPFSLEESTSFPVGGSGHAIEAAERAATDAPDAKATDATEIAAAEVAGGA